MIRSLILLTGMVWFLAGAPVAQALTPLRTARQDTITLTLRQCLERAMSGNLDVRQKELELDRALIDRFEADMSRWVPVFKVHGLTSLTKDAGGTYLDSTLRSSWDHFGPYWEFRVEAAQPLTTFGRITALRTAARHGVEAGKADVTVRRAQVASEVYRLYYGVLLARELLRILDDANGKLNTVRSKVRRFLKERSGRVTTVDLAKLDVYAFELERKRFSAEKNIALALGALRRATGIPYDTPFDIVKGRLRPLEGTAPPLDSLQELALGLRPEMRQVEEGVKARRLQVVAAEAERYPIFYLGARFKYHGAPGRELRSDNPFVGDPYNSLSAGAALGLTYDIDLSSREAKIRRARVAYKEMLRQRAWARASVALEVQRAYLNAEEARNNSGLGTRSLRAGRAWLIQTLERYDLGVAGTRDLLEAYGAYGKSQSDYYQTLYDHYLAMAELYRVIGRPIWKAGQMLDPPQD